MDVAEFPDRSYKAEFNRWRATMRLKTFHAKSLQDAMTLVREQLGDDAIIVATQESGGPQGARVTAAVEQEDDPFEALGGDIDVIEAITEALERHGTPPELTDRLVDEASMLEESDPVKALTHALAEVFRFDPLPEDSNGRPLILIGPLGVGKTVGCVKLAARAALKDPGTEALIQDETDGRVATNRLPVHLVGADKLKIGAMEQLALYADKLGANMIVVSDGKVLSKALKKLPPDEVIVIDTPGTNPFNLEELAHIVELAEAADMDPVLVLTAGRDAEEAADLAKAFRPAGATRLLITGYDIARRLGSMLAAAVASDLALSDIGRSPRIADGFQPLDAATLARMLLPKPKKAPQKQTAS